MLLFAVCTKTNSPVLVFSPLVLITKTFQRVDMKMSRKKKGKSAESIPLGGWVQTCCITDSNILWKASEVRKRFMSLLEASAPEVVCLMLYYFGGLGKCQSSLLSRL